MKFDLKKTGLETIFKPWQIAVFNYLLEDPKIRRSSFEVWQAVPGISRASVINFLDEMVEEGLLDYKMITGKGGWRRLYKFKPDITRIEELKMWLYYAILKHAQNELLIP